MLSCLDFPLRVPSLRPRDAVACGLSRNGIRHQRSSSLSTVSFPPPSLYTCSFYMDQHYDIQSDQEMKVQKFLIIFSGKMLFISGNNSKRKRVAFQIVPWVTDALIHSSASDEHKTICFSSFKYICGGSIDDFVLRAMFLFLLLLL